MSLRSDSRSGRSSGCQRTALELPEASWFRLRRRGAALCATSTRTVSRRHIPPTRRRGTCLSRTIRRSREDPCIPQLTSSTAIGLPLLPKLIISPHQLSCVFAGFFQTGQRDRVSAFTVGLERRRRIQGQFVDVRREFVLAVHHLLKCNFLSGVSRHATH